DVVITTPMASSLWNIVETKAAEHLELLWNDALLLSHAPAVLREQTWLTYRLHDLLHDMARRILTPSPPKGFGITLQEAHATILDLYRARSARQEWHTLPDDGYIHAHLIWHMEQAGWHDEIHTLLRKETSEGRNTWYQVRNQLCQTAGYPIDVA